MKGLRLGLIGGGLVAAVCVAIEGDARAQMGLGSGSAAAASSSASFGPAAFPMYSPLSAPVPDAPAVTGVGGGGMTNVFNNPFAAPMIYGSMSAMYPNMLGGSTVQGTTAAGNLGMTASQLGWAMLATQPAMLGIGSGRLSGVRGGAGSAPGGRAAAGTPSRGGTAATPGGLAARYFNRTTRATPNPQSYFNRQPQYFPRVGR
jgi:hypothetical protein